MRKMLTIIMTFLLVSSVFAQDSSLEVAPAEQSVKASKRKQAKKQRKSKIDKKRKKNTLKPLPFPQGSQKAIDNVKILNYIKEKGYKNVQYTDSGLYYIIENEGDGEHPTTASMVNAHYHGELLNGSKFDSSYDRNQPLKFSLQQVIKGWGISIPLLKSGGKGKFIIPSNLAYGKRAVSTIPPNSILVFDIELISFE